MPPPIKKKLKLKNKKNTFYLKKIKFWKYFKRELSNYHRNILRDSKMHQLIGY
jgi:hypothetical protein